MGKGYPFTCSNCGYEKELMKDQGFIIRNWSVREYQKMKTSIFITGCTGR